MTETWPTSPSELRQAYESVLARTGKSGTVSEMVRIYGVPTKTVYNRLQAAGILKARDRPMRPSPEALAAEFAAARTEQGDRAAISTVATRYEVDYVTIRRWLMEAGLWSAKERAAPIRPITTPCPCGAVAYTRYKGEDPPLCANCYMRKYAVEQDPEIRRRVRYYVAAAKRDTPCADCGGQFPEYVKDFDHVPGRGPKLFNLANPDRSMAVVKAEMAKCDIVCANCHRIRTWARKQGTAERPAS